MYVNQLQKIEAVPHSEQVCLAQSSINVHASQQGWNMAWCWQRNCAGVLARVWETGE